MTNHTRVCVLSVGSCMSQRERDKEKESLCEEFGKLNKVPQESLPKDLGECSRFQGERPLKSENTLALSY